MPAATDDPSIDPPVPYGYVPRSADQLNQAYDLGLDPYTGQRLVDGSGQSVSAGRSLAKLIGNDIPAFGVGGAKMLSGNALNQAMALRNGSGTPYDNPNTGGEQLRLPEYRPDKALATPAWQNAVTAPARDAEERYEVGAHADAENQKRGQILKEQQLKQVAGPELSNLYDRLPDTERAFITSKAPEDALATLRSHPLRGQPVQPPRPLVRQPSMYPTINPRKIGAGRPFAAVDNLQSANDYFGSAASAGNSLF